MVGIMAIVSMTWKHYSHMRDDIKLPIIFMMHMKLKVRGHQALWNGFILYTSLALLTLYPKSRVVESGLFRYAELCTDQKLVYPIRMRFQLLASRK